MTRFGRRGSSTAFAPWRMRAEHSFGGGFGAGGVLDGGLRGDARWSPTTSTCMPALISAAALRAARRGVSVPFRTSSVTRARNGAACASRKGRTLGAPSRERMKDGIAARSTSTMRGLDAVGIDQLRPVVRDGLEVDMPRGQVPPSGCARVSRFSDGVGQQRTAHGLEQVAQLERVEQHTRGRDLGPKADLRKYCCRLMRSRSPCGNPWRCRTNASACATRDHRDALGAGRCPSCRARRRRPRCACSARA